LHRKNENNLVESPRYLTLVVGVDVGGLYRYLAYLQPVFGMRYVLCGEAHPYQDKRFQDSSPVHANWRRDKDWTYP